MDYNSLIFGTLTFLPGVTSLQVIVPIYGDVIDEEDETFLFQISANALNPALVISDNEALGTITDDDPDTTPPVLNLPASMTVEATGPAGAVVNYPNGTAVDLVAPLNPAVSCLPASGSTFPLGTTTVTCSATDTAGNTGSATFTITVVDTTAPVITMLGTSPLIIPVGGAYADAGATAMDLVDGELTSAIVATSTVNTGVAGSYTVTLTVTNAHGTSTASRTLDVAAERRVGSVRVGGR